MSIFRIAFGAIAMTLLAALPGTAPAGEMVRIGGTGMGLATMRLMSAALAESDPDIATAILPSLGSGGGIEAMLGGVVDIALSNRPLKASEAAKGARNAACVQTPFILVTSLAKAPDLKREGLAALYSDPAALWADGTPVRIVLRTRDDSDNATLIESFPGMEAAIERARHRPDVPLAATDQDNADFAQRIVGSLAATTLMQLRAEHLKLTPLTIDGVAPSVASLADGSYKLGKTLCLLLPPQPSAGALRVVAFVRSAAGASILASVGTLPAASGD